MKRLFPLVICALFALGGGIWLARPGGKKPEPQIQAEKTKPQQFTAIQPSVATAKPGTTGGEGQVVLPQPPPVSDGPATLSWGARVIASGWAREDADAHAAFRRWVDEWVKSGPNAERLARGIRLATERREFLKGLMNGDPRRVLEAAVPFRLRYQMPSEVLELLETRVDGTGELNRLAALPQEGRTVPQAEWMEALVAGKNYRAHPAGEERKRTLGWATLHGVAIDGHLAVSTSPVRAVEAGERFGIERPLEEVCPVSGKVTVAMAQLEEQAEAAPIDVVDAGDRFVRVCLPEHTGLFENQLTHKERLASPWIEPTAAAGTEGTPAFFANRPSESWATGVKKVLVIRVDFADLPGEPLTETAVSNTFNNGDGVKDFYERCSFGRSNIDMAPAVAGDSSDVTSVLRLPQTAEFYALTGNNSTLHADARAAATLAGFDMSTYDRIGVYFAWLGSIPGSLIDYGGLGSIEGKNHWLNGNFGAKVIAHEIGHNYGLPHASRQRVLPGSAAIAEDGEWEEYGDDLDVMGGGPVAAGHFNMWSKAWLYWLDADGARIVTTNGTYRIGRFDHQNADPGNPALPLALRIPRQDGTEYWVGHRRLFPANAAAANGAYIIWAYDRYNNTRVIDTRTPSDTDASDAPLPVGETFIDAEAGVTFTTVARGGSSSAEWLDVQVTLTPRLQGQGNLVAVNEAAGTGLVMVRRVQSASGTVSANWATAAGTATSPQDYTSASGALNWADGDALPKLLSIPLIADGVDDPIEDFDIGLSSLTGASMFSASNPLTVSLRQPGAFDPGFQSDPFINSTPRVVCQDLKGRIIIGGHFFGFGVNNLNHLGRMLPDGTEDTTFTPTGIDSDITAGAVYAVAVQSDGKILIGGDFIVGGVATRLARLNDDGSFDPTFNVGTGPNNTVRAITLLSGGKILVGGLFTNVNGTPRRGLVRLSAAGAVDDTFVDTAFTNSFTGSVRSIALQADGKIIVGGSFATSVTTPFRFSVARLNADGTTDGTFDVGFGIHAIGNTSTAASVEAVAVLPNGKIAVGGSFQRFNNAVRNRLVVLDATGTPATGYGTGFDFTVATLTALPDNHLVVGGSFTQTTDTSLPAWYLACIKPNGTFDDAFAATHLVTASVNSVTFEKEGGRVLVCGGTSFFEDDISTRVYKLFSPAGGAGPAIISQPVGGQVNEGGSRTLSVSLNAAEPYCQWYRNNAFIPGATSLTYEITDATEDHAGTYVAKIVNAYGAVTSSEAVISVNLPPNIDSHPANLTVNLGQQAQFTVVASGVGLSYQWQKGTDDIDGATEATYTIPVTTLGSAGSYRCVVSNFVDSVPSNPATLIVVSEPVVTGHPASLTRSVGQSASFTVTADGLNLSYQWQKNEQDLQGQTNATLTLSNLTLGHSGSFRCLVSNSAGTDISDPAVLSIIGPSTIIDQPKNRLAKAGDSVTMSVAMAGTPTTFQWYRNSVAISGATQKDYIMPAVSVANAGDYMVKMGTLKSVTAKLIVITPAAIQRPGANGTAVFKLTPSVTAGVTYQWLALGGGPLAASTRIQGPTTASLTIKNCTVADEGNYFCEARAFSPVQMVTLGPAVLDVVTVPVVDAGAAPAAAIVSGPFSWQIVASQFPTKYAVTGLPAGLVLNAATGLVSGIPNAAPTAPITLKVTATNAAGTSAQQSFTLSISPFPPRAQGAFSALVAPNATLNDNLGGLLTLTVTDKGSVTGKLQVGALSYSIATTRCTASLTALPVFNYSIVRKGLSTIVLDLEFDPNVDGVSGEVSVPGAVVNVNGWRHVWNVKAKPATGYAGSYNATAKVPDALENDASVPQGHGWIQTTISTAGVVTGGGRTPDGATFTLGGALWPAGQVPVQVLLFKNKGSLHGEELLVSDVPSTFANNTVGGTLRLIKTGPSAAADRTYKMGYAPVALELAGEKWVKPSSLRLLFGVSDTGVNNATLDFGQGGLKPLTEEDPLDQPFLITKTHTAKLAKSGGVDNPKKVVLTFNSTTGTFTGSFTLVDENPSNTSIKWTRTVPINGVLRKSQGWGHFVLPELPGNAAAPALSGTVEIKPGQ